MARQIEKRRRRGGRGSPLSAAARLRSAFTLIEVVASVAILGCAVVGLLLARSHAQRAHLAAVELLTSTRLCAGEVALLRAGAAHPGQGPFSSPAGYRWQISPAAPADGAPKGLKAYEVRVIPPSGAAERGASAAIWLFAPSPEAPVR